MINHRRAWSFESGRLLKTFSGHQGIVTSISTDVEGKILFTASTDATIRSWKIESGEMLKIYEGHTGGIICMTVSSIGAYDSSW